MKVYKYHLPNLMAVNKIMMPVSATPISVGIQGKKIVLWVVVGEEESLKERTFFIVGTGQELPDFGKNYTKAFLGTVQMFDPQFEFVWHVFEIIKYGPFSTIIND